MLITGFVALVAVLSSLATGSIGGGTGRLTSTAPAPTGRRMAPTNAAADARVAAAEAGARHFKGDDNAPVTIIEISDFTCEACQQFATGVGRQIDQLYVQHGEVRFGYLAMANTGSESQRAAEAGECAAEQYAFWPYYERAFAASREGKRLDTPILTEIAAALRLDTTVFTTCLASGMFREQVRTQTGIAQQLDVSTAPAFLINGKMVLGAQPFAVFQQLIEAELTAAQQTK